MAGLLNAGGEPSARGAAVRVGRSLAFLPRLTCGIVFADIAERKLVFQPIEPVRDDGVSRRRKGQETIERLAGGDAQDYFDRFAATAADLAGLSIDFGFGEALARRP